MEMLALFQAPVVGAALGQWKRELYPLSKIRPTERPTDSDPLVGFYFCC